MLRRTFLKAIGLYALAPIVGCKTTVPPVAPFGTSIDAHCHVFNASDLPATRFIRYTFLDLYPETQAVHLLDVHDPDIVDSLIAFFEAILGANSAPSAAQEVAVLSRTARSKPENGDLATASAIAIDAIGKHIQKIQQSSHLSTLTAGRASADQKVLDVVLQSSGGAKARRLGPLTHVEARQAAAATFVSPNQLGVYFRWFRLFTLYRHKLVDLLISDTQAQGLKPVMLAPATVDFDKWLNQDVDGSPLAAQVEVMDRIARRDGPAVHGYFGFDPLREIYYREHIDRERQSPIALARKALVDHGFLGIKLYPPMGFSASGNAGPYPKFVTRKVGNPSKRLDQVLDELYQLCVDLDAPILAHAYGSNGAGKEFAERADPAYWVPVFRAHPKLRVCLAHFGRFDLPSSGSPGQSFPERSWEWTLGRHLKANPHANVVADLSYFSEVLNAGATERKRLATDFRRFIDEFDPGIEHLVYGTDWIMIGLEGGYPHYAQSVDGFLRDDCGLNEEERGRIFRGNAVRFMGLGAGEPARRRLLRFYRLHGLDPARLPVS
ncbi:amidohydrolase [Mesorhizobium sp. M7D.F.Ca.US.005.01.1.1]|uniref:amidohydrolase family protein n=1 Tax=Mesorhizobium sp. M7D.F.Ca.US.005.01.1.1 TaxID=2493678 RepID=UPI000F759D10|nr:amidohydrolase family protein [Mesorhizobium sp. M7D.F.Ca.US.005.01.1.1]AZO40321.1 amidohydrolase [Mesorhizobium sp. M7D.F.Ca.US.005.01.1.1]